MTPPGSNGAARPVAVTPRARAFGSVEAEVTRILQFVGEDPAREGLRETPGRMARALLEMTSGYDDDPKAILGRVFHESYDGAVVLRDVEFWSLCEHHLLPFHGSVSIAYLPQDAIVGLSKLARLVHCFARRLQVQERLTQQIAQAIEDHLQPKGVAVHVSAKHQCMSMRGVRAPATTDTCAYRGTYRNEADRREIAAALRG